MKIVILDGYTENPGDLSWKGFEELGELTVYERTGYDVSDEAVRSLIIERAKGAEAIILNKTPIDAKTLDALAPTLKYIGVLATGFNVVDVKKAGENGVVVCNIPTYGTDAVAQMTVALLLELCHHVGEHSNSVFKGEWAKNADWCYWNYPLVELAGKTAGLIGFGRIGQSTAGVLKALGMNILAYDEYKNDSVKEDFAKYVSLDYLLENSDVVSLHCPLTPTNGGMINSQSLCKMKKSAFLINTSRGQLINEEELAKALNDGIIAGAALDVVSSEPIKESNPMLKAKNCIITPHIAWAPKESRNRLLDIAVDNLKAYVAKNPQNIVNQ